MTVVEAFEHVIRLAYTSAKYEKDYEALNIVREAIENEYDDDDES